MKSVETLRLALQPLASFLLALAAYWDILLLRCAVVSVLLLAVVLFLRAIIPQRYTWLRAAVWSVFILAPFFGKLRLWYEQPYLWNAFWFIHSIFFHLGLRLFYPLPTIVLLIVCVVRQARLQRRIRRLPTAYDAAARRQNRLSAERLSADSAPAVPRFVSARFSRREIDLRVTPLAVSPFSCGLFRPRIVLPEQFLHTMEPSELDEIILHERTHIRLGHLWFFFLWDILCALLYPNIFLRFAARLLREDMEAVCDRATIQTGGRDGVSYGRLILKSIRLTADDLHLSPATLFGEKSFAETKRRIRRILHYTPYRSAGCAALLVACLLFVVGALAGLKSFSYPRWEVNPLVTIANMEFADNELRTKTFLDEEAIGRAVSYDRKTLTIDRAAFAELLRTEGNGGVDQEHIYILFDCFMKMPGIGGGGQIVEVDLSGSEPVLRIPYEWSTDVWTEMLRIL